MGVGALAIKLRCASWEQLLLMYERDLRRNVLFLRTQTPPPLGTQLHIDLALPSSTVIPLDGAVARHVTSGPRGAGVELALKPLAASTMWLIESALQSAGRMVTPREPAESASVSAALGDLDEKPAEAEAEEALVQTLAGELASLKGMNAFQVLQVPYDANDEQVRNAFAALSKKVHPDRFARYESERARTIAAEIFIVTREAYRRIADATARAATLEAIRQTSPSAASLVGKLGLRRVSAQSQAAPVVSAQVAPPPPAPPIATAPSAPPVAPPMPRPPVLTVKRPPARPLTADDLFSDLAEPTPAPAGGSAVDLTPSGSDTAEAERLLDAGLYDQAFAAYEAALRRRPTDRAARVGRELARGFRMLADGDREGAAAAFDTALEIDPLNERAARELAAVRRAMTESRRGVLARLLGKRT